MRKGYSIFKRGGPRAKGPHIIAYYEVAGDPTTRRTVRGCFSKTDTEAMARKLADEARLRAKGINDPKVEQYAAAEAKPLKEHLEDFTKWLAGQQCTAGHVETIEARASRIIDRSKATRIHELTISRVGEALDQLRGEGLALQTLTHYVRAIKPGPAERTAPATADERLEPSRCGNDEQHDELDTEDTEAVSYQALGNDLQGSALPVGRDGVWWPHWSSKPVAGR
jgi:hypothetical protein